MDLLIINGHDYSQYVLQRGFEWSRNDLDSSQSFRTKDGNLRRDKITTKRKITFIVSNISREKLQQLDSDLSSPTFSATYTDLHGQMTKTFYCSTFGASIKSAKHDIWESREFSITEV